MLSGIFRTCKKLNQSALLKEISVFLAAFISSPGEGKMPVASIIERLHFDRF